MTQERLGKTRRDHKSGAHERRLRNLDAARSYHRSGEDRPSHFNGKKQFQRLITVPGNKSRLMDRVGKHPIDDKMDKRK